MFKTTVTSFVDDVTAGTVAADFAATPNVSAEPDNAVCGKTSVFGVTFFRTCVRALALEGFRKLYNTFNNVYCDIQLMDLYLIFEDYVVQEISKLFCLCLGAFLLEQKPGFPRFRVLRAPYFAAQSTPTAPLQSFARFAS